MMDIYRFLTENGIGYTRYDHPPVFTVADVHRLIPDLPAAKVKNLFLRDDKGTRHFLLVVGADKRINLKDLAGALGVSRISFASADRLKKYLAVEPGSVSLLAVANDGDRSVEVVFDRTLWTEPAFQFHPLVNTSTLIIAREDLSRFLTATGHDLRIIDVP